MQNNITGCPPIRNSTVMRSANKMVMKHSYSPSEIFTVLKIAGNVLQVMIERGIVKVKYGFYMRIK